MRVGTHGIGPANQRNDQEQKPEEADPELDTLKGGFGKGGEAGKFEGYCNHFWIWGHKRQDCRKLTAEKAAGKGKGKGDDSKGQAADGKGKNKGWQPYKGGGWQTKGGGGKSKGFGKGKKGGFGGTAYNIDGDYFGNSGYENQDWSWGRFFMLQEASDSEDDDLDVLCQPCEEA